MTEYTKSDWKALLEENMRTGYLELLILQLLSERDMYGYELMAIIIERSKGVFTFREGSMYITLMRMKARGLVTNFKQTVVGKRFRTYYHIEEFGREYLLFGKRQMRLTAKAAEAFFTDQGEEYEKQ